MLLAQTNIARFRWPLTDPRMTGFREQIDPIHRLAEDSEGFVWRFAGDYQPRDLGPPWDDPLLFFNLSLWRDFECLSRFVRRPAHQEIMRSRSFWTAPAPGPSMALWWVEADVRPTVSDAIDAISSIAERGDSRRAFTSRSPLCQLEHWLASASQ